MSSELSKELEYSQQLVKPLLETLQWLVKAVQSSQDSASCKQVLDSTRLLLRVFFSLNSPGLTEVCPFTTKYQTAWQTLLKINLTQPSTSAHMPSIVESGASICLVALLHLL